MAGTFSINLTEARGYVANPADIDRLALVMGCNSGQAGLSTFFFSGSSAQAIVGYGDAPDTLFQIIEQRQSTGQTGIKVPACFYGMNDGVPGSYGAIDISGVIGTAIPTLDSGAPFGTYNAAIQIVDDGNGGAGTEVGTAGILYQWALDYAETWSITKALGTAFSIAIPNSGVGFTLEPPAAQITAFIAAVVEARTDTLAHLADVVAHDAADTSAEQVALAASSPPTTAAEAWAVMNLIRAAYESHRINITAHNGPDPVNVITAAVATTTQTGISLYTNYRTAYNAHLGIALAAVPAGLKASFASSASPVTLTNTDFLDAGETAMDLYPRRITITTGGATPSDVPDTVDITGFDYVPAAQSELGFAVSQIAGAVTTTKAWRGTGLNMAFPAGQGVGGTLTIGYGQGVHNSADVTNTLTSTSPTHGTLKTGDVWRVRTLAPAPTAADIDNAFADLVANPVNIGLIVLEFPLTAALADNVQTGINNLNAIGIRPTVLARTRIRNFEASETEAAWVASVQADLSPANFNDSRFVVGARYGLITDALTSRQYLRSTFAQFCADVVRVERAVWPSAPADQTEANVTLADASGLTVGHDEGPRGAATGLSNDTLGNRFACEQRIPDFNAMEAVYNTVPWTMAAADDRIKNLMVRRVANAIERTAISAAKTGLGGQIFYNLADPNIPGSQPTLTEVSRMAIHAVIYGRLATDFASDIQNADNADVDTGLVQVSPNITVSGGNLIGVSVTIAPRVLGYLLSLSITLAVQE